MANFFYCFSMKVLHACKQFVAEGTKDGVNIKIRRDRGGCCLLSIRRASCLEFLSRWYVGTGELSSSWILRWEFG